MIRRLPGVQPRLDDIGQRLRRPLISVIVPVYNVEEYLEECLQSVRNQSYRHLQIILIDDGSTDGSAALAAAQARSDRRIKLVRQANAGLGAARNTGVRQARGRYLCFVDSDDLLVKDAIERLWASISASGSDFVVGSLRRFTSTKSWIPQWAREVHRKDRHHITLAEHPDILKNVFAWNKLFEAEFFRAVIGSFPEGVRYEDQEPTARGYVNGTFDVLAAVVYRWREREDGSSITQQKSNHLDLLDRLAVKQKVARVIATSEDRHVRETWFAKAAGFDLRPYFEVVPRTDEAFWTALRGGLLSLAQNMEPTVWPRIPLIDRLPALAALADLREDVATLVVRRAEYGWAIPGSVLDRRLILRDSYLEGLSLAPEPDLLVFGPDDLRVVATISHLHWQDQRLRLDGFAYLLGVDLADVDPASTRTRVYVELLGVRSGRVVEVEIEPVSRPRIDMDSGDAWSSHAASGFIATIEAGDLSGPSVNGAADRFEDLQLSIRVESDGVAVQTDRIDLDHRGTAGRLPVGPVNDDGRWTVEPDDAGGVQLRHQARRALRVDEVGGHGAQVEIVLSGVQPEALQITCSTLSTDQVSTDPLQAPTAARSGGRSARQSRVSARLQIKPTTMPDGRTRFSFTVPEILDTRARSKEHHWNLRAVVDGERRRLMWPGSSRELTDLSPAHRRVRVICSRSGAIRVQQNAWWAAVSGAEVRRDQLLLTGRLDLPEPSEVLARLVGNDGIATAPTTVQQLSGDCFTVEMPLRTTDGRLLSGGGRLLRFEAIGLNPPEVMIESSSVRPPADYGRGIAVGHDLIETFPLDLASDTTALTCSRTRNGGLWIGSRLPYAADERGRLAQRRLHEQFLIPDPTPLREAAVFECFNGKFAGDSVRALFEQLRRRHPDWPLYWSVADLSVPVPEGGQRLLRHSRPWMETVAHARYLVNNNNFPAYFRKRPGQVYLQTWHGTPLKKIGNDVPAANLSLSYRQLMVRDVGYWDYLLAQNDFAASTLPAAFAYHGRVLNLGYPRNDSLLVDADRRTAVRASLGLDPDQQVVLYAPTWRDNVATSGRRYAMVNYLDFTEAARRLPHVTFLLRGHANTVATEDLSSRTVIDVSQHPDINELMIAADALVTDYSSVMFDFCVTGRPILFLVPDLDFYRDVTRGFYLNLADIAPGPLCATSDDLLAELVDLGRNPESHARHWRDRYAAFITRFAPRDDGFAAERVAEVVW